MGSHPKRVPKLGYLRAMRGGTSWIVPLLLVVVLVLFVLHVAVGTVRIPWNVVLASLTGGGEGVHGVIVREVRLPQALTALLAGAALATSGLFMQTLFRNPLAGPSVLGLTSGASLGVAILLLAPSALLLVVPRELGTLVGAFLGAMGILAVVLLADRRVGDGITLLIIGLMLGYLCSALISVLQVAAPSGAVKSFVLWGMGSFAAVPPRQLPWLGIPVVLAMLFAFRLAKPLNALLLGADQASAIGVEVPQVRRRIMWITGVLAGTVTAFCGPVAFLGLATPHVARALVRTSEHGRLLPVTALCGAALALTCDLIARLPGADQALPLNAVTSLLGAPVVAWVLLRGKQWVRAS